MTIYFPDVSVFKKGLSIKGVSAVCAKATEGNWLPDPTYSEFRSQAEIDGIFFFAYHFLEDGSSPQSQAAFCHSVVGGVPLMLDFEPIATSSRGSGFTLGSSRKMVRFWALRKLAVKALGGYISEPSVLQALAFIDAYRALGGVINLVYFPHWYWTVIGSPSLKPFEDRGVRLVSSQYALYSDSGPGWQPYGGMTPTIWQYSDSVPFNGFRVDFNAFRGTLPELKSYVRTGHLPIQPPAPQPDYTEESMVVLDPAPGVAVSLPVPAKKTKLLLYADSMGSPAPKLRVGWDPHWDGAHTLEPAWGKPAVIVITQGATQVTISREDTSTVPITVDWA